MARCASTPLRAGTPAALCGVFAALLAAAGCSGSDVSSYAALAAAVSAGGIYSVTQNIVWPASGTLTLSNVALTLIGACSPPNPCVLDADQNGGHFRVFNGANLTLVNVSVENSLLVASNGDCYVFNPSLSLPACGAITVANGSFAASDTSFKNNVAKTNGGSTGARLRAFVATPTHGGRAGPGKAWSLSVADYCCRRRATPVSLGLSPRLPRSDGLSGSHAHSQRLCFREQQNY